MLKSLAVVVFLAIILPIYGCKESSQTGGGKSDPNSPKEPASVASGTAKCVVKEEGATIECKWPKDVPESYFKRLFSPENAPNIALFFVGIGGIGVAFVTLRKIERQTCATEVAAKAAKTSADIAAGVSVPTLVIQEFETGNVGAADTRAFFQYPKVKISVKNYGNTPAFLKWWSLCFGCREDLPEVPIYDGPGDGMILDKIVVQPNETYTFPALGFPHQQGLSLEDIEAIVNREKLFCAYGYICYGDIFGNPLRRLKFCETVLNIIPGYGPICDWHEGICPREYAGTDLFPMGKTKQQQSENPK